jgi:hypothetical protein
MARRHCYWLTIVITAARRCHRCWLAVIIAAGSSSSSLLARCCHRCWLTVVIAAGSLSLLLLACHCLLLPCHCHHCRLCSFVVVIVAHVFTQNIVHTFARDTKYKV